MMINPSTVHIWKISTSSEEQETYFNLLSKDEKLRANKFRFTKDRKTYVIAKGVLRVLSGYYLNQKPEQIEFEYSKFEKPKYKNHSRLKFNVSHSGNYIIIGFVNEYDLGVDIEYIKKDFDVLDIADNFFSTSELDALHQIDEKERIRAFYRCWTRKESFIKAEGSGLSFPLDTFSVTLDTDLEASLLDTQWSKGEKDKWSLFSFIPYEGYIAAISVRGVFRDYLYMEWNHSWGFL